MGICLSKDVRENSANNNLEKRNISLPLAENGEIIQSNGETIGHVFTGVQDGPMAEKIIKNFKQPKVPVIFVLGGPGSGKITHCEATIQEKEFSSWVHISMTESMNQMIENTDNKNVNEIPTRLISATLMLAMTSSPQTEGFIVSGYPRSMRDTSEYLELFGHIDAVVLINWHLYTLERQIQNGAKQGLISLSGAHIELDNFKRHVIPVAEFFDTKQILHLVTGDRGPEDVYRDFKHVFYNIVRDIKNVANVDAANLPNNDKNSDNNEDEILDLGKKTLIWVVGGPGSKKYERVMQAMTDFENWKVISTGKLLWDYLSKIDASTDVTDDNDSTNNNIVNENKQITKTLTEILEQGNLVPHTVVVDMLKEEVKKNIDNEGFVIVGFPRNINQVHSFQTSIKVASPPVTLLLDCSEMELARNLGSKKSGANGRLDDNKEAVARRLTHYREITLPMLKTLDEEDRLRVVDGDKDEGKVLRDLQETLEFEIFGPQKNAERKSTDADMEEDKMETIDDEVKSDNSERKDETLQDV